MHRARLLMLLSLLLRVQQLTAPPPPPPLTTLDPSLCLHSLVHLPPPLLLGPELMGPTPDEGRVFPLSHGQYESSKLSVAAYCRHQSLNKHTGTPTARLPQPHPVPWESSETLRTSHQVSLCEKASSWLPSHSLQ